METNLDLTAKLKKEAQQNEAFRAVCTVFAVRERARQQVTVAALSRVMHREGFELSTEELKSVLVRLAELGVGKIDRDPNNRLRALKDIKIRLQAIGKAAVDGNAPLVPFKPQVRFKNLPPIIETPAKKAPATKPTARKSAKVTAQAPKITVAVTVGKERIQFEIPVEGLRLSK